MKFVDLILLIIFFIGFGVGALLTTLVDAAHKPKVCKAYVHKRSGQYSREIPCAEIDKMK